MQTEFGRPRSSMRLRTWTATSTSVARRSSACERSPSPITRLKRNRLPRPRRLASYSRQFMPLNLCREMRWRRSALALNGTGHPRSEGRGSPTPSRSYRQSTDRCNKGAHAPTSLGGPQITLRANLAATVLAVKPSRWRGTLMEPSWLWTAGTRLRLAHLRPQRVNSSISLLGLAQSV